MKAATSSHTSGIVAGSFLPREQPLANSLASSERASLMSSSKFAYKQKLNIPRASSNRNGQKNRKIGIRAPKK